MAALGFVGSTLTSVTNAVPGTGYLRAIVRKLGLGGLANTRLPLIGGSFFGVMFATVAGMFVYNRFISPRQQG